MTDSTRLTGRVKWFNSKTGYGFITVSDDGNSRDIFVHYSNGRVGREGNSKGGKATRRVAGVGMLKVRTYKFAFGKCV